MRDFRQTRNYLITAQESTWFKNLGTIMFLLPTEIIQIIGHNILQSVKSYSNLNENKYKQFSKMLLNYGQNSLLFNQFNSMAQHSQNMNNTKTVQADFNSMFSGNIIGGTFNKNIANKKNHLLQSSVAGQFCILTANKGIFYHPNILDFHFSYDPISVFKKACIVYCVRLLTGITRIPVTVGLLTHYSKVPRLQSKSKVYIFIIFIMQNFLIFLFASVKNKETTSYFTLSSAMDLYLKDVQ